MLTNGDMEDWSGPSLLDSGKGSFILDTEGWIAWGDNTIENDNGALKIIRVGNGNGAYIGFYAAGDLSMNLTVGKTYKLRAKVKVDTGDSVALRVFGGVSTWTTGDTITSTTFMWTEIVFTAEHATAARAQQTAFEAGEILWIDEWTIYEYSLQDWDVTENGSGTVRRSTINNGGNYSVDLYNPPGGGNTVKIKQDVVSDIGTKCRMSFDVRCDTADRSIQVRSYDPLGAVGTITEIYSIVLANTWYTVTYDFTWGANDNAVDISTRANGHYYIDNVTLKPWYT